MPRAFLAVNLPCGSCRAINTFEPGELRILHSFAVPVLAREAAWEERYRKNPLPKPACIVETESYAQERVRWSQRMAARGF